MESPFPPEGVECVQGNIESRGKVGVQNAYILGGFKRV